MPQVTRRTHSVSIRLLLAIWALAAAWTVILHWHTHVGPVFAKSQVLQTSRIKAATGRAFKATLPRQQALDENAAARAEVLENGRPLKRAGSISDIEKNGAGLFRIKPAGIWFAASDDTSPLSNGRRYELRTSWKAPAIFMPLSLGLLGIMMLLIAAHPSVPVARLTVRGITRVLGWISIPDASMDDALPSKTASDPDRS